MGSATSATGETFGDVRYEAEIRRTEHGVAHVKAADLGGLGFGQGYACAADHLPTICDQVTKASAQRSAYLGTGVPKAMALMMLALCAASTPSMSKVGSASA